MIKQVRNIILFFLYSSFTYGQIVFNNNVFLTLDNDCKVVINNSDTNAIKVSGSGANIVSESENSDLIWMTGNAIGTFSIPFTTTPVSRGGNGIKIPLIFKITSAGSNDGRMIFSTYETNSDMNNPYPSTVNNMYSSSLMSDGSLYAVDRFWKLDGNSYSNKPDIELSFSYDDNSNEIGGSNLISEANLRAQRYNESMDDWQGLLFGSCDPVNNKVENVIVSNNMFHQFWSLVDLNFPLPVTLGKIEGECNNGVVKLKWNTLSETNNSHFIIEESSDGINFFEVGSVAGNGNSSLNLEYFFAYDPILGSTNNVYLRLRQVDFNGVSTIISESLVFVCSSKINPTVLFNENQLVLHGINYSGEVNVSLFDYTGKLIHQFNYINDDNYAKRSYSLPSILSKGIYIAQITTDAWTFSQKFLYNK